MVLAPEVVAKQVSVSEEEEPPRSWRTRPRSSLDDGLSSKGERRWSSCCRLDWIDIYLALPHLHLNLEGTLQRHSRVLDSPASIKAFILCLPKRIRMLPSSSLPFVRFSSVGQRQSRVHALDDELDLDGMPSVDFLVAEEVGRDDDEGRDGRRKARRHRPKGRGGVDGRAAVEYRRGLKGAELGDG